MDEYVCEMHLDDSFLGAWSFLLGPPFTPFGWMYFFYYKNLAGFHFDVGDESYYLV